jgi:hypothetical protein
MLRNEAGFALPMALVLMLLGSFLVAVSANLAATTLKGNIVVEQRTEGFYAADAGIEDVVWKFKNDQDPFDEGPYELSETLNGMTVTVEQFELPEQTADGTVYTVKSTARLNGEIKGEIIAELVGGSDFTWFFDAAITSAQDVTLKPGTVIIGDVVYGDDISNQGTVDGEIINDPDISDKWPSAAFLSNYYYSMVDDLVPYPSDEIMISGTQCNPTVIGPLYRNGNLTFKGSGWARIDGIVYVTGTLTVNPTGGCDIDLNGKTIYSAYYNNCSGNAIYIGPKTKLWGSGCIIAVGNISFQPNLAGTGEKLVGLGCDQTSGQVAKDTFLLSKFTAGKTGTADTFRVNCSGNGNVKVALYADNAGLPGALLGAVNDSTSVGSGWNNITFPATNLTADTAYWLGANSSAGIICYNTSGPSKTKGSQIYSTFTFPLDLAGDPDFIDEVNKQYLFAGYSRPFVFVMSIECSSDIKPGGTFYGSIAGDAEVELYPGTTLTWTQAPTGEGGLIFPGSGSIGGGAGSADLVVRTYTIH